MHFSGKVSPPRKGDRHWGVRISALGVFTQGKSEKDAYAMAADALETLVDQKGFHVEVAPLGGGKFLVSANNPTPLIARWLHHLRLKSGLNVREAAARLGSSRPEAWARYESGRSSNTIGGRMADGNSVYEHQRSSLFENRIEREWLSTEEAAHFLCLSPNALRIMVHRGQVQVFKVGRRLRFRMKDCQALFVKKGA